MGAEAKKKKAAERNSAAWNDGWHWPPEYRSWVNGLRAVLMLLYRQIMVSCDAERSAPLCVAANRFKARDQPEICSKCAKNRAAAFGGK
jgi:hypothetical protein